MGEFKAKTKRLDQKEAKDLNEGGPKGTKT
jgi:hypothetical protein